MVYLQCTISNNEERQASTHRPPICAMIYDIQHQNGSFRQKARLVAGGHMTEALDSITHASIVSRETVRIALMTATLIDLEVK